MNFLKKLSLQHLAHDQLYFVAVLCGGVAALVMASVFLSGGITIAMKTSPTSLAAGMTWARDNGLQSWHDGYNANAAEGQKGANNGYPAPRGCRVNPDSEDSCVTKDITSEYRIFGVFAIFEKDQYSNGKRAHFTGKTNNNRYNTTNWNNSWTATQNEPGNPVTIEPGDSVEIQWICQDLQVNYFQDECGLGGLNMCESTRAGHTRDLSGSLNSLKPILLFNGAGGDNFSTGGAREGSTTVVPPPGTTTYRLQCRAASGVHAPWLAISVYNPGYIFTVTAIDNVATEQAGNTGVWRVTRNGNVSPAYSVGFSLSGTAGRNVDYTVSGGSIVNPSGATITFPAGASYVDITLTGLDNNSTYEPTETATLTVGGSSATINISDSDGCPAGYTPVGGVCTVNATANLIPNDNTGTSDNVSVVQGGTVKFEWTTTNVVSTSCAITRSPSTAPWSGGTTGSTGVERTVTIPGTIAAGTVLTYTLSGCTSTNGTPAPSDSVAVTVTAASAPTASLSVAADTVANGGSTTLTWSCTNSATGRVTNNRNATVWTALSFSGQSTGALTQNTTYTLTCTNVAGVSAQDTQLVEVCTTSQHVEGGNCVSNTRTCTPLNAPADSGTQTWSGGAWGACIADSGETPQGNCNAGYHVEGGACVVDQPQLTVFLASPARVQQGADTTLTWVGTELPDTCQLTSSPAINDTDGGNDTPRDVDSTWTGNSPDNSTGSGVQVGPIEQTTIFTLSCGGGQAQKTVTVVPNVQEI
jgi:hypothetical protein